MNTTQVAFLSAMVGFFVLAPAIVGAFEPHDLRHYPSSSTNSPMMVKGGSTGVMNWAAEDSYGYPGWRNLVHDFLSTGSTEANSLGNVVNRFLASEGRGSIAIRENAGSPDLRLVVASTAFVE